MSLARSSLDACLGASKVASLAQVAPLSCGAALPTRTLPVVSPSRQFGLDLRAQALLGICAWRKLLLLWMAGDSGVLLVGTRQWVVLNESGWPRLRGGVSRTLVDAGYR